MCVTTPFIFSLNLHYKFQIEMDWDVNGKLFLHKNGQVITLAFASSETFSKLQSAKHQEIQAYTTVVIQAKPQH